VARRWWRIGLSAEEIKSLEAEARAFCANGDGPGARRAVLSRARSFGKRHSLGAMRLSRLAACMADQIKETPPLAAMLNDAKDAPRADKLTSALRSRAR
jgi:hypothetical protein